MKYLLSAAAALALGSFAYQSSVAEGDQLVQWHTQILKNTMFSEHSPGFNDLYMIQTPDKGRQVVIYCNPSYCYKLRGHHLTA